MPPRPLCPPPATNRPAPGTSPRPRPRPAPGRRQEQPHGRAGRRGTRCRSPPVEVEADRVVASARTPPKLHEAGGEERSAEVPVVEHGAGKLPRVLDGTTSTGEELHRPHVERGEQVPHDERSVGARETPRELGLEGVDPRHGGGAGRIAHGTSHPSRWAGPSRSASGTSLYSSSSRGEPFTRATNASIASSALRCVFLTVSPEPVRGLAAASSCRRSRRRPKPRPSG